MLSKRRLEHISIMYSNMKKLKTKPGNPHQRCCHGRFALAFSLAVTATLLSFVTGCDNTSAVVSGSVTYDGQVVKNGSVLFQPVDGKGTSCGGPIVDGRYKLETSAGKKVVQIVAVKEIQYGRRSPEEDARLAREAFARGDTSGIIDRADVIPANAQGNNAQVDVAPGQQTLDFDLKRPLAKPAN